MSVNVSPLATVRLEDALNGSSARALSFPEASELVRVTDDPAPKLAASSTVRSMLEKLAVLFGAMAAFN